jgi:predicted DNA-binding transcriptional regulator YafY
MGIVLEKIEMQLDEETRKKLEQVRDRILMDVSEFEEIDIKEGIFNIINQSIISQRGLNLKYHTMGMEKLTKREINPYALIYRAGAWYLIATCPAPGCKTNHSANG